MGAVTPPKQRILITGASGFVGRSCVMQARSRGHKVLAVVRNMQNLPQDWDASVQVIPCDLAKQDAVLTLSALADEFDTVIHCAARLTGSDADHAVDTLAASENLISGVQNFAPKIILVSSLSVYSGLALAPFDVVDESTPLEDHPQNRDAYCRAKLQQESLFRAAKCPLTILRLGAVYGAGSLWNGHLGVGVGAVFLQIGRGGEIPVTHVDHAAFALILAAENDLPDGTVLNVVDDDLPQKTSYLQAMRNHGFVKPVLVIPWQLFQFFGRILAAVGLSVPGLLRSAVLRARMMPLKYHNQRLKDQLNWHQAVPTDQAIAQAMAQSSEL